jgi:hypothetical protein
MLARSMILGVTWSALALVPRSAPDLSAQYLPVYGGSGGAAFTRSCGSGKVLTGIRYRAGMSIDAIGLLCRQVLADGSLGSESTVGTLVGGGGGTAGSDSCPAGTVITGGRIHYGTYVDAVSLYCHTWDKATRTSSGPLQGYAGTGRVAFSTSASAICEQKSQPMVALRGREASMVDALGFICNEP